MKNANPVCSSIRWLGVLLALLAWAGCDEERAPTEQKPKTVADHFEIRVGGKPVQMQLAVLMPEMERGLMERRDLGRDEGMLFVYNRPQQMSFWMRNTPTPLDIGFFNAHGMLEEIYPLYPYDETPVRSRSTLLSLALEMNQGWFRENGVKPGAELDMDALRAALQARGFEPRRYGLEN
ncbi:MAG TPA: DUF192 domain-containing protein [Opitutus sp.]|nr:DUF192 domain-containing protein [Opitutus sp.]